MGTSCHFLLGPTQPFVNNHDTELITQAATGALFLPPFNNMRLPQMRPQVKTALLVAIAAVTRCGGAFDGAPLIATYEEPPTISDEESAEMSPESRGLRDEQIVKDPDETDMSDQGDSADAVDQGDSARANDQTARPARPIEARRRRDRALPRSSVGSGAPIE